MKSWNEQIPPLNLNNMPQTKEMKTLREELLDRAKESTHRKQEYGKPENSFNTIAKLWEAFLGSRLDDAGLEEADVALMLALVKVARLSSTLSHEDSWVDLAGYAACGFEATSNQRAGNQKRTYVDDHKYMLEKQALEKAQQKELAAIKQKLADELDKEMFGTNWLGGYYTSCPQFDCEALHKAIKEWK